MPLVLTIPGRSYSHCDRLTRRDFLRVGGLGLAGLTLADLLRQESRADAPTSRPKSLIYIVLSGGQSHIDTYDPKPDAPDEVRGPFRAIPTRHPGVRFAETMPRQAKMADRFTLLRGVRSVENDHFLSEVYTGLPRTAGRRPAFGSVISRLQGGPGLPSYVSLSGYSGADRFEFEKPHYLGASHAPFRPYEEALQDLSPVKSLDKLADRKGLLNSLDRMRRDLDSSGSIDGLDKYQARALEMISSPRVRQAFDLSKESPRTIENYGRGKFSHQADFNIKYDWDVKPFILARRLVEAGVRVVTLQAGSWDHHSGPNTNIFKAYDLVMPVLDQTICALLTDMRDRGLDEDVLVVVLSEFGRTPKIGYPGPGREHWAEAGCVLMAGGGITNGLVLGETDSRGERARTGNYHFQNVMSTIYHVMGVDPRTTFPDFNGRPQYLLDDPDPIRELLG